MFWRRKIDDEGTSIFWAYYENYENFHLNPVLFILPGITGKYDDSYVVNIVTEGLKNNFDVVVFKWEHYLKKWKCLKIINM